MVAGIHRKFHFLLKLFSGLFICTGLQQTIADDSPKTEVWGNNTMANVSQQAPTSDLPKIGEWGTTIAHFEITDYNIDDFNMKNSVLEALVKASGKDVNAYLEEDKKTIRMFKVSYRVPMKIKKGKKAHEEKIVQFGLFKALNPAMQDKIDIKLTQSIPIQFKTNDPLLIIFVVKDETFSAPALLTDKVKLFDKSLRKHEKVNDNTR